MDSVQKRRSSDTVFTLPIMSENQGCCPEKSEPILKNDPNYTPQGYI